MFNECLKFFLQQNFLMCATKVFLAIKVKFTCSLHCWMNHILREECCFIVYTFNFTVAYVQFVSEYTYFPSYFTFFPVQCLFTPKAQKGIEKGKKSTRFCRLKIHEGSKIYLKIGVYSLSDFRFPIIWWWRGRN